MLYACSMPQRTKTAFTKWSCYQSGHANNGNALLCVSKLYFSTFAGQGPGTARHSGIRALFHQHIVKPGLLSILDQTYDKFFDTRREGGLC